MTPGSPGKPLSVTTSEYLGGGGLKPKSSSIQSSHPPEGRSSPYQQNTTYIDDNDVNLHKKQCKMI